MTALFAAAIAALLFAIGMEIHEVSESLRRIAASLSSLAERGPDWKTRP